MQLSQTLFSPYKLIGRVILPLTLVAIFSLFIIYPIIVVISGVFIVNGEFTLTNILSITYDPFVSTIILNTLIMGGLVTLITTILAIPYAYILDRYDIPFKSFFLLMTLLPFVSPPYVGGLGYINLLGRQGTISLLLLKAGLINKPLEIMYQTTPIINPFTGSRIAEIHWGAVIISALTYFPLMALTFFSALQNIDESLEEEAYILGAKPSTTFFRITLKSAMPGLIAGVMLVFISFVDEVGIPLIVGYRNVMAVAAYDAIVESSFYYTPRGYVFSLIMIVIGLLVLFLGRHYISLTRYVSVVRGAIRYRKIVRLTGLKRVIALTFMIIVAGMLSISTIGLLLAAFATEWYLTPFPTKIGLDNFVEVFEEYFILARNSIIYSVTSMLVGIIMSALIAYMIVRMRIAYSGALDYIITLPLVVPGIVIGIGNWAVWRGTPLDPFVNPVTIIALVIAFRKLPYAFRAIYASTLQIPAEFEEAGLTLGANRIKTFIKIMLPALAPALIAGGLLAFIAGITELSSTLVLSATKNAGSLTLAIFLALVDIRHGPTVASAIGVIIIVISIAVAYMANKFAKRTIGGLRLF